jgi:glyoxylase-like metal-dependent hydrolase (beta-lactamase superfamily II)
MFTLRVGEIAVTALSDGYIDFEARRVLPDVPEDVWAARPEGIVGDDLRCWVTSYLIRAGNRVVLVDTGIGPRLLERWRGNCGALPQALTEAGVAPADVDTVICTHLHADHIGWNTVEQDGELRPTFPRARYLVHRAEWPRWQDSDDFSIARSVWPLLASGHLEWQDGEGEAAPGVHPLATPGHTPGHISVLVYDRGEGAVITGDAAHHPLELEHPDWSPTFDADRAQSAETRRALVERIEDEGLVVLGGHFPPPHAGRLVRVQARSVYEPLSR